jgi:hypothetical protein
VNDQLQKVVKLCWPDANPRLIDVTLKQDGVQLTISKTVAGWTWEYKVLPLGSSQGHCCITQNTTSSAPYEKSAKSLACLL